MNNLDEIIIANFTETNRRLDDILAELERINEALKRTNNNFNE